ncbi:uncharacterized protein RJT21DRAFT_9318 [Scheffersomyces amazonensis]|uniref:uncharacterized protein n=1 Tax=Scheffersomyces amazonensis TaxID=1078765 RepID=UPI00315D7DA1
MTSSNDDEINTLKNSLFDYEKFNIEKHDRLITLLSLDKKKNLHALIEARKTKQIYFLLTPKEYSSWLQDVQSIESYWERIDYLKGFYFSVLNDHPVVLYWAGFLDLIINDSNAGVEIPPQIARALKVCSHDYKNSHKIWDLVFKYYLKDYEEEETPEKLNIIIKLHLKRLSTPHETIDKSFEEFSSFISEYDSENYESQLLIANKIHTESKKQCIYYDKYEIQLAKNPSDINIWTDYLKSIAKYSESNDIAGIITLFERFLASIFKRYEIKWINLWYEYIYCLYEKCEEESIISEALLKFIKSYPDNPRTYAEHIRFTGTQDVFPRMDALDLLKKSKIDDWKLAAMAILSQEFDDAKKTPDDENKFRLLYMDLIKFCDLALADGKDKNHSVEKLVISILLELDDHELAEQILTKLRLVAPTESNVWLYSYTFYRETKAADAEFISSLFKQAMEVENLDDPEKIHQEWLTFESAYGDRNSYNRAAIYSNAQLSKHQAGMKIKIPPVNEKEKTVKKVENEENPSKKRKYSTTKESMADELKRSREKYCVSVYNLPSTCDNASVTKFFEECGPVINMNIIHENDDKIAIIEFNSDQAVLAALTKDFKKMNGEVIRVRRHEHSIVFVSNFPSSMRREELVTMFENVGKVVSARYPSQIPQKSRRFCFLEYSEEVMAREAVKKFNNMVVIDRLSKSPYTLKVEISDPEKADNAKNSKLNRDAPMAERKIKVFNLPTFYTEQQIGHFFTKFGGVDDVTIPRTTRRRNNGQYNDGIAVVLFKSIDSIKKILSKAPIILEGHELEIDRKVPIKIEDFQDESTMGIRNLDRTISVDQLKSYLAEKGYMPIKVAIYPEVAAALAQFATISDSGKAAMALDGQTIGQNVIETATKSAILDLRNGSSYHPSRSVMIPPNVQRRRR